MIYERHERDIDKFVSEHVRYLKPEMKSYFKLKFEEFTNKFYLSGQIELKLVVDASMMIAAGISKCKGRLSFIYLLVTSPHLKLCAPPKLNEELEKNIPKKAKEINVDPSDLRAAIEPLLSKITILNADDPAIQQASRIIGGRDPEDVSYVGLIISTGAHGVITNDNDMKDTPQIVSWNLSGVAKVLTTFENGSFSFHALAYDIPLLARLIYEVSLVVLTYIWRAITGIVSGFAMLIGGGIAVVSESPALAAILLFGILAVYVYAKDAFVRLITEMASKISNFLNSVYNGIKAIIDFIGGLIQLGISALLYLCKNIENTLITCNNLAQNPAAASANLC